MMQTVSLNSYKGREVDLYENVNVYRNLTQDTLSVRIGKKVHGHADMVALSNVSFKINENARQRVNRTKHKEVHAFVNGTILLAKKVDNVQEMYNNLEKHGYTRVSYNPYKYDSFVEYHTLKPVVKSEKAIVIMDRIYIKN